jgi:hypothetical protein
VDLVTMLWFFLLSSELGDLVGDVVAQYLMWWFSCG